MADGRRILSLPSAFTARPSGCRRSSCVLYASLRTARCATTNIPPNLSSSAVARRVDCGGPSTGGAPRRLQGKHVGLDWRGVGAADTARVYRGAYLRRPDDQMFRCSSSLSRQPETPALFHEPPSDAVYLRRGWNPRSTWPSTSSWNSTGTPAKCVIDKITARSVSIHSRCSVSYCAYTCAAAVATRR